MRLRTLRHVKQQQQTHTHTHVTDLFSYKYRRRYCGLDYFSYLIFPSTILPYHSLCPLLSSICVLIHRFVCKRHCLEHDIVQDTKLKATVDWQTTVVTFGLYETIWIAAIEQCTAMMDVLRASCLNGRSVWIAEMKLSPYFWVTLMKHFLQQTAALDL